jgi:hypothetical protein
MNTNNSGITNVDVLSVGALYVGGKRFRDIIRSLIAEDTLEQGEIDTLRTLLANLNTDGLTSEWIVNNDNRNAVLKTLITAIETKLAKIDTTALTETSVLNNDNRNSVLKTRLDTAATDIDNLENKTKYITSSTNIQPLAYTSTPPPAYIKIQPFESDRAQRVIDLFVNPDEQNTRGYNVEPIGRTTYMRLAGSLEDSLTTPQYNRIDMGTYKLNIEANDISITCNPLGLSLTAGELSVPGIIRIGAKKDDIFIGCEEPNPGSEQTITIGVNGFPTKSITKLNGFLNTNGAQWLLPKSDKFGISLLIALIPTGASVPLWMFSFALGSVLPSFEYSDVFVMKDGPTGVNKLGDLTTSNDMKLKSLVIFDKDLVRVRSYPIEGTFVARGTISKTTLDGSIRNSVFLDGSGDNKIAFKHHNIAASDITEWATTEANNKINVIEIGGNSGILIHQGASNEGEPLRIIHSKKGSILLALDNDGTMAGAYPGLEVKPYDFGTSVIESMVRIGFNPLSVGNTLNQKVFGSYALEVNHPGYRDGMVVAKAYIDAQGTHTWLNVINGDSINTPGTITGITLAGKSLVISENYTGDTTNRLYKNADNKLMWNGAEVGAGGASSGGITYMINVPTNITNPNSTPTETIMTAAYSGNPQRTITQAITANTAYYIAKYTTEVFDEGSNPVLTGLQQLNQYLVWNSNSQTGQIYGRLWFQATAIGLATLYQRTYVSPVTTTAATFINGTPIPTPKGLYNLKFQRVVFPNINVVVSSGPVVLRYRVEGYTAANGWVTLTSMGGLAQSVSSTTNNLTVQLDEMKELNQTTAGSTALRLVIYIDSGTGTISQTSAGGADLGAYSLIGLGVGTPGLFRTMLYDGTNAKIITPYSTTPTLIEYDMAIDAPYNVSSFPLPTLSTELYFIQPAGGFNNHAITLYFNEGSISHFHSSIATAIVTPTLASVLNSGATASQPINMNTNKISGITALEGSSGGNWNVKEITAGTNIGRSVTDGNYTITNTARCQELSAGFGIQLGENTSTKTYTIYNNAAVQNIEVGNGLSIQIDIPTRTATITNTAAATLPVIASTARDEHQTLMEVGALPRKPDYWAKNWSIADTQVRSHRDMYVSVDGKIIASASGNFAIRYSKDYGTTWADGTGAAGDITWTSICGTSSGSKLFAFGRAYRANAYTLFFYTSVNQGETWTQITSSAFSGITEVNRVRCSGEGTYLLASDATQITEGRLLYSTNGGVTWVRQPLSDLPAGNTIGVCMSRSGAVQFIVWVNTALTDSRIFRSLDYGYTFSQVQGNISDGGYFNRLESDATGRFVYATRFSTISALHQVYRSDNYGETWATGLGGGQEEVWVSATGQFVAMVSNAWAWNVAPYNGFIVSCSFDYGRQGTFDNNYALMGQNTIRTINGSGDGSVLVLGSVNQTEGGVAGDGKIRIARSGQINLYDRLFATDIVLWYSGIINVNDGVYNCVWPTTAKIDLTKFNIRYEIDINYNYLPSQATAPSYIQMGLNAVTSTSHTPPGTNKTHSVTNWTNIVNNGASNGTAEEYNQTYRNRFYCGYRPPSTWTADYRNRQRLSGEISYNRRTTDDPGISPDYSANSREIINRYTSDHILVTRTLASNNDEWYVYSNPSPDTNDQHHRIHGTSIWNASAGYLWTANEGTEVALSQGINNIALAFQDVTTPTTTYARPAEVIYRIWRVKK